MAVPFHRPGRPAAVVAGRSGSRIAAGRLRIFHGLLQNKSASARQRLFLVNNENFSLQIFSAATGALARSVHLSGGQAAGYGSHFYFWRICRDGRSRTGLWPRARYLEMLLRERFPGEKFEVINLGIHRHQFACHPAHRPRMRPEHGGDLWIIYMGNNEMVGPFGRGHRFWGQGAAAPSGPVQSRHSKDALGQLLVSSTAQIQPRKHECRILGRHGDVPGKPGRAR